jgi:hypothetical protein
MKRVGAKLLTVVLSIVVARFILEVFLRIAGYSYPVLTTTDQTFGVALRPGAEGWYRKEGEAYIHINSDGLRDKEHVKTKPRVTERVILAMRDRVQAKSAKFFVVTLSKGIQVAPDAAAREQFRRTFKVEELFYPDKRIKALGQERRFVGPKSGACVAGLRDA